MPGPFPGFDPYLEAQGYWREFHTTFLAEALYALGGCLPDAYEVRVEERLSLVYADDDVHDRDIQPDVSILRSGGGSSAEIATTVAAVMEPVVLTLPRHRVEEMIEKRLAIRRFPDRELVTVIELLSPSHKQAPGDRLYDEKRLELIHQKVHLIELDLLIGGRRLTMGDPLPKGHYYAFVARAEQRYKCAAYAWTIRDRLPTVPIPLKSPDRDVFLDLAALFASVYDRARLGRSIDYSAPLGVPLAPEDRSWAEDRARDAAPRVNRS